MKNNIRATVGCFCSVAERSLLRVFGIGLLAVGLLGGAALGADTNAPAAYQNLWFPVGETLIYKVQWGVWIVAETRVTSEWLEEDGRKLIAIRVTTKTRSIMDKIFPVDDFLESVVDPETFLPLRFTKRLSEGRYRLHEITTFNHAAGTAFWRHLLKDKSEEFAIEPDTRDLLSFMYYMRSQKFELGKHYQFRVMADEKLYDLFVDAIDYETLEIGRYRRIRSLRLYPEAKFHGLFVRVGRLDVWISDDDRCLCVRAMAQAPIIGTIRLLIDRVEGPGLDFWTRPDDPQYPQKPRAQASP